MKKWYNRMKTKRYQEKLARLDYKIDMLNHEIATVDLYSDMENYNNLVDRRAALVQERSLLVLENERY